MIIAIAGYSGFIGSNFINSFPGYEYIKVSREDLHEDSDYIAKKIEDADIILSLTGYPINKRWTARNKKKIKESRAGVNRKLVAAINSNNRKPIMFITASAIGIYEDNGKHNENSDRYGSGFMADVVKDWEEKLLDLEGEIKTTYLRTGVVLGKDGGVFPLLRCLTAARLGAIAGTGRQYYSFIHIDDVVRAIDFVIKKQIEGPVNLVSPGPVEQRIFMEVLGKTLHKKVWMRVPSLAVRLVLGKASQMVTKGQYVIPAVLLQSEFEFKFSSLEATIENLVS